MLNYIRTTNLAFTFNGYSCIVHGVGYSSLLRGKFANYGRVILSSNISQESKLRYITRKCNLLDADSIISDVPKKNWMRQTDFLVTYSFTVHEETAGDIAAIVMDSVSKKRKKPIVMELNPGVGLITKNLFERGLKNLVVYDSKCWEPFKKILQKYEKKIELHEMNAFDSTFHLHCNFCFNFFDDMSDKEDNEILMVGVSPNRLFYRRLVEYIIRWSYSCFKNVELFVTIPDRIYNCVITIDDRNGRATDSGCFSALFNVEVLKKYPRDYFLPLSAENNADVYLIKVTRKADILPAEELLLYRNFLRVVCSKKSNYIIGELERWLPGSGPYFIAEGVPVTAQTFEFSSEDLLRLFKIFRNIKGYDDSIFVMKTLDCYNNINESENEE